MSFSDDPRKVRGKGTAYPVGSEKHVASIHDPITINEEGVADLEFVLDESMQPGDTVRVVPPVYHAIGPVDTPKPTSTTVVAAVFTQEHIAGLVNRTLALDPKYESVLRSIDGRKFRKVRIDMAAPGPGWLFTVEYEL